MERMERKRRFSSPHGPPFSAPLRTGREGLAAAGTRGAGLAAVAEALADPEYRSCLESGHIAGEAAPGVAETSWQEPRMEAAKAGAGILELRARLAFEDGNAAGGMADVERLRP